ncbi:hypothetical protein DERF_013366 [Dermatophagoides farinae]|uniref:Uncharacterized protein n=1 Tax=Dermatophagoides farinae TaxID=6954 RepID=A0A922KV30_DERFA|nr:hypothetical protein DERF_013366 [Dermatophagoides farinae]
MNYNGTIVVTILTCFTQPILNNKVARAIRPSQSRFSFEYDHQLLIPPPAYDINNGIYQQARGTWYKCLMMKPANDKMFVAHVFIHQQQQQQQQLNM